jgi:protein-tyrosine phosphatase
MLYYNGIGNSDVLGELCLNKSNYLLLEFTDFDINEKMFEDLLNLRQNKGITPIIAHIERYSKAKNFKKFLAFLEENKIPVQINAASVFEKFNKKVIDRILKSNIFCVLATDTHSVDFRPPLMKEAYCFIRDNFGGEYRAKLAKNSCLLYKEIIGENVEK